MKVGGKLQKALGPNDRFPFGKHKGERIKEVLDYDASYITWWDENIEKYPIDYKTVTKAIDQRELQELKRLQDDDYNANYNDDDDTLSDNTDFSDLPF